MLTRFYDWFEDAASMLGALLKFLSDPSLQPSIKVFAAVATIVGACATTALVVVTLLRWRKASKLKQSRDLARQHAQTLADTALRFYRAASVKEWSRDRYGAGDRLFTRLSLLLDRGQDEDDRWRKEERPYEALAEILTAHSEYHAFVVLGVPGAGKSTLLRRLDLDIARENLHKGSNGGFSYFVSLRDYRGAPGALPPSPMEWLREKWSNDWQRNQPGLPSLEELLSAESYLLLDALNEMPVRSNEDYSTLVDAWKGFIRDTIAQFPKCRMLFSCRSMNYSASLSSDVHVPHIEIEKFDEATVLSFLHHYAPLQARRLIEAIKVADQLDLYSNAYFLRMLCDHAGRGGEIPQDRSALFTAFVRELLRREFKATTRAVMDGDLLSAEDRSRCLKLFEVSNPHWNSPYELPARGPLFPQLARLAYAMQLESGTLGNSQVATTKDSVRRILRPDLDESRVDKLVEAGSALTVLEDDWINQRIQFVHQLMQEYFAGRRLSVEHEPDHVRTQWLAAEARPSLTEQLSTLNINEPLPMLESTGWEESTLLAAAMANKREEFIESLIERNLPLAGRAAAQIDKSVAGAGDGSARLRSEFVCHVRRLLLERMADSRADLRARIVAGKALGELGHPSFKRNCDKKGRLNYLVPPLVRVPGNEYWIGSDAGVHSHERTRHAVKIAPFHLARFPVTNGEWECFIRAGGYDDATWWRSTAASRWQKGETTRAGRDVQWRAFRRMLKENPDYIGRKLETGEISPKAAIDHHKALDLSDEAFEATLREDFLKSIGTESGTRYREPRRWRNRDFNNPLQPVVGICWFEAQAYCAWLSAQTGQHWRLPSEAEWEAAARLGAPEDANYPWGPEFDSDCCNSFESHIRATTPVGIFPRGTTAAGLVDICGNAYEWTSSKYDKAKFPYPYDQNDGRESLQDVENPIEYEPRVLRGGSWYYAKNEARVAFRMRFHPGYHNQSTGLRLVLAEG